MINSGVAHFLPTLWVNLRCRDERRVLKTEKKEVDMKFGMRTPSLKRSISARTTGRLNRAVKRAILPGYGRRGMGWLHPRKAIYNRLYRHTTFSIFDVFRVMEGGKGSRRSAAGSGCCIPLLLCIAAAAALCL